MISLSFIIYHLSFSIACSDTWDDHYEATASGANANSGTLWQAIQKNSELTNFASVVSATGYDKTLNGSQVFTVFAPTNANFTKAQADALIQQYGQEKLTVKDEDNTVIKEFVQNHIALYNHSVSSLSNDSIVLMNGKYAVLQSDKLDNSSFNSANALYENGILYTLGTVVDYSANIFEAISKDADLDSVRSFLYNPYYYKKVFDPSSSVEGGINDLGQTEYLDSVYYQSNELFSSLGRLSSEDSLYWMVAPTNEAWKAMVEEYEQHFQYLEKDTSLLTIKDYDSLVYTNTRRAILEGTAFSKTFNREFLSGQRTTSTVADSLNSTKAKTNYNRRLNDWGVGFGYYEFYDPMNTVLNVQQSTACSNGRLMKVSDWKISPLQTFNRWIVMECEGSKTLDSVKTNYVQGEPVELAKLTRVNVNNEAYKGKIWGDQYAEIQPQSTLAYDFTLNITDVLSNVGYDIYLVAAPALANDSNATATEQLPTRIKCTMKYPDLQGKEQSENLGTHNTTGTEIDYMLLAEDFKFPVARYGLEETEPLVTMLIENQVSNRMETNGTHTRVVRLDCILIVPHGTLELTDDLQGSDIAAADVGKKGVLMYPFGKDANKRYYKLR